MKECPNCKKIYRDFDHYCMRCNYKLQYIEGSKIIEYCPEPERLISKEEVERMIDNVITITCPYCQSTDTKKITTTGRMFSMGFFGLASGKVGKQWHCNKCKSDF